MTAAIARGIGVDDVIRVLHDVPQVGIRGGEIGVVQSRWFAPDVAFEVEFHNGGIGLPLRVILNAEDIDVATAAGVDALPRAAARG